MVHALSPTCCAMSWAGYGIEGSTGLTGPRGQRALVPTTASTFEDMMSRAQSSLAVRSPRQPGSAVSPPAGGPLRELGPRRIAAQRRQSFVKMVRSCRIGNVWLAGTGKERSAHRTSHSCARGRGLAVEARIFAAMEAAALALTTAACGGARPQPKRRGTYVERGGLSVAPARAAPWLVCTTRLGCSATLQA